ncbi:MAG TPA: hypothetical protein VJ302_19225, partial [Blastocatellia bacterium]|nr:hypothetical protein [Blastocatellia bacterium]
LGHPRNQKQPSPGKTDRPDFQPTFRPNYKQLQEVRQDPHHGPIENIRDLERVLQGPIPNLAVRAYTAATVISLSHSQKLIMELTGESGTQRLIEVTHDSSYEAKIVLNNNIDHAMTASKDHDGPTPSEHYFHFRHFYQAIKGGGELEKVVLANEKLMVEYVNERKSLLFTGGSHPNCPVIRLQGRLS